MIFWLFGILTIITSMIIVATLIIGRKCKSNNRFVEWVCHNEDIICTISALFSAVFLITTLAMLSFIISAQISANGTRAQNEQRYEALVYKAQSENVRDDFGITNKEYLQEVQEWNEEFAKYQVYSDNFWIGIFYPEKVYDGMSMISLEDVKMGK